MFIKIEKMLFSKVFDFICIEIEFFIELVIIFDEEDVVELIGIYSNVGV